MSDVKEPSALEGGFGLINDPRSNLAKRYLELQAELESERRQNEYLTTALNQLRESLVNLMKIVK